eukprot:CAMPEP_0181339812 /NCGR_PEP_ID=MMETSP1101-20121128/29488_1 /TAXON_ID=46948 /ORGANISM="Rhodomonas abbreviata, Strain Caron Lab Isolate" /LENGTH=41 /DNA_ID= /DNA_START= /DNA_END= /DNA_ORIENTATION=
MCSPEEEVPAAVLLFRRRVMRSSKLLHMSLSASIALRAASA